MSTVEYGEFKGNKVIILRRNDRDDFPFQFGAAKGRLILENIEEIEKFVAANPKK